MAEDRIVSEPAVDPVDGDSRTSSPGPTPERVAPVPDRPPTLTGRGVRARLARIGTSRQSGNPVLEPLFRTVRANHPKADLDTPHAGRVARAQVSPVGR